MAKWLAGAAVLLLALAQAGCHHSSAAPAVTIVMSPTSATLNVSTAEAFYAAVAGGTNNTVTWNLNNIPSTDASSAPFGTLTIFTATVDSLGNVVTPALYTAPATIPAGTTVTITAISTDNTSVKANAKVTILAAATVTVNSQQMGPLAAGQTRQFTATVQPAPSQNVDWEVNGLPGGSVTVGTINSSGLYTAPLSPPPGGSVTITAVSLADNTQSGSATVTLTFGTGSLQGSYAFTLKGQNASGPFERAGSFTADGNGGLNAGIEDVTNAGGSASTCGGNASISFVGSYTVGADGRGTLQFSDGLSPSTFRIVMAFHNQVEIVGFTTTPPPTGTAQGEADLQNGASFKATALQGAYLFDFSGQDSGGAAISEIGEFQADGQGGLHNGIEDVNDAGLTSQPAFTGTYCVTANGRGTAQFAVGATTYNFSFYIVSSGALKFVSLDASPAPQVGGTAKQQAPGASFSESSLSGNYSFLMSGGGALGNLATAGEFFAGGNDLLTGGVLDENAAGTATLDQSFTGTYSIDATGTGRGEATLNATNRTYTLVFYLDGNGGAVFQETDSDVVSDGVLAQQTTVTSPGLSWALASGGAPGATTEELASEFVLTPPSNFGCTATSMNPDPTQTVPITSGTIDSMAYPGSTAGTSVALTGGVLTPAPPCATRSALTITTNSSTLNFIEYSVSQTEIFVIETDSETLTDGLLLNQY